MAEVAVFHHDSRDGTVFQDADGIHLPKIDEGAEYLFIIDFIGDGGEFRDARNTVFEADYKAQTFARRNEFTPEFLNSDSPNLPSGVTLQPYQVLVRVRGAESARAQRFRGLHDYEATDGEVITKVARGRWRAKPEVTT